ncbi:hypothetical protein [Paludibaculum fermentans]|uniref:hypothetical protein n=1 Tax=Paludibaculum fermentans TaxID=1473598 RepID=UPI003EC0BB2F
MNRKPFLMVPVAAAGLMLGGCGARVSGVYKPDGAGFLDGMNFKPDGKVDLTFMTMTKEGTFAVDGKRVKVTNGGDTQVFTLDDRGCLDGGQLLGRYCKDGKSGAEDALSGAFVAQREGTAIQLNFHGPQAVRVSVVERGVTQNTAEGSYRQRGDRITVSVAGGEPLELRRSGDGLEATMEGHLVKFVKR